MLQSVIDDIASRCRIPADIAEKALGSLIAASERQGAPFSSAILSAAPDARRLADAAMADAPRGALARLIERTPGGRVAVIQQMLTQLRQLGLGPNDTGALISAAAEACATHLGVAGLNLGDLFGSPHGASSQRLTSVA
jgi:hypothetical protein